MDIRRSLGRGRKTGKSNCHRSELLIDIQQPLLLARATTPEQAAFIGNQAGGRVWRFLRTDDFWRDYHAMRAAGVVFVREPTQATYGTVAVFEDLYGNRWDLIELTPDHPLAQR